MGAREVGGGIGIGIGIGCGFAHACISIGCMLHAQLLCSMMCMLMLMLMLMLRWRDACSAANTVFTLVACVASVSIICVDAIAARQRLVTGPAKCCGASR